MDDGGWRWVAGASGSVRCTRILRLGNFLQYCMDMIDKIVYECHVQSKTSIAELFVPQIHVCVT